MSLIVDTTAISATSVLVTTLLLVILYKLITAWLNLSRFLKEFDDAPTPEHHWLLGHALIHPGPNERGLKYDLGNTIRFPKYFILYLGRWHPVVQIVHPDSAREILKHDSSKAFKYGGPYKLVLPWVGYSLVLATGDAWKRMRRLLTPAFHFGVLKQYMKVKNDSISYLINSWKTECGLDGKTIEITAPITLMALEILMRCAFSYHGKIQEHGDSHPYVEAIRFLADEIFRRGFSVFERFDFIYFNLTTAGQKNKKCMDYVHNFARKMIKHRRGELKTEKPDINKRCVDFLDVLILAKDENGQGLTDEEIRSECDTFLFAGHDTTKAAMTWVIYNLATHPECQAKAYDEVLVLFEGRETTDVTLEDLNEIPYLTMCLKESMRRFPTVFVTGRDLHEPTIIDGRKFPAGTQVFFNWYAYHHNPVIWGEDHMEFKPERFLHEKVKDMDPFAHIPFSAGPRNCIGINFALHEVKMCLIKILLAFEMKADNTQHHKINTSVILSPVNGMHVHLTPRS